MKRLLALFCALLVIAIAGCSGQTDPATNVTAGAATLNAHISCNQGESGKVWWRYRKITVDKIAQTWFDTVHIPFTCPAGGILGVPVTYPLQGLQPKTQYQFEYCSDLGGDYGFCVNANGQAGPVATGGPPDPIDSFTTRDTPDTVIDDIVLGEGHQVNATFHGLFQSANSVDTYNCHIDGQAMPDPCTSPKTYDNLPPGTYTFSVAAIEDGVADPTPATRSFTINQPQVSNPPSDCVPVESQSWWNKDSLLFPGDSQHVHVGACFPWHRVISGDYTLNTTIKMHNEQGRYLIQARIDDATAQDPQIRFSTPVSVQCQDVNCIFNVPITVPTDQLPAGMHEWRVGAVTSPADHFSSSVTELGLATDGWQVCIRSCSGRTPANPRFEGRGWYETQTPTGKQVIGYNNVTWGWTASQDAEFPWDPSTGTYRPISGTWQPPLWIHNGASDGATEPITRSRCWVDPDFHNGISGTPVLDQTGSFQGRLSIDTTQFPNGLHKLVCAAGSSANGFLDGVQVFPFLISNP